MLFHVDNIKIKQKNPVIRYKIANVLTEFTMFKPNKIKKKRNRNSQILLFRYGASVLTGLNEKCSKIKGFRQSINGINLKIKYFSFQNTLRY